MKITERLAKGINAQIGHEFQASQQYLAVAGYFKERELTLLHNLFMKQSEEEREHALKFVNYIWDTDSKLEIPALEAPYTDFKSSEEVLEAALKWEQEVTRRINELMTIAIEDHDYQSQSFLRWFIDEQFEEESSMTQLLNIVRMAGEKNMLRAEAYLGHLGK